MHVTLIYAGLLAFLFLALSIRVIQKRRTGISFGDGGDKDMLRRIRGHGNFSEYVPLILLMMAMLESAGLAVWALHAIGTTLLVSRLLHGYALSYTEKFFLGRFLGALGTLILLAVCGALCLGLAFVK